jgi:DNA-binding NarL/FixJ family response regulator
MTVLVVDPRPLTRECLAQGLTTKARDLRVRSVANAAAIATEASSFRPVDLVLLNIGSADVGEPHVAEILKSIQSNLPDAPVVVLSEREESEAIVRAFCHGLRGYLLTSFDLGMLIEALRFVRAGGTFAPVQVIVDALRGRQSARGQAAHAGPNGPGNGELSGFTPRQLQVLDLLCQGKSNKIIGYQLAMQESTVKVHVRDIMKKLKATNRTQAALIAQHLFAAQDGAVALAQERSPGGHANRTGPG